MPAEHHEHHDQGHSHAGHSHAIGAGADARTAEDRARPDPHLHGLRGRDGVVASSLALLSDAAHMLTDAAALGLAIVAARLGRPARPGGKLTYGLGGPRSSRPSSNGVTLIILAAS